MKFKHKITAWLMAALLAVSAAMTYMPAIEVHAAGSEVGPTATAPAGNLTTGGYWVAIQGAYVHAGLVPGNTESQAEDWIQQFAGEPSPPSYDAAPSGVFICSFRSDEIHVWNGNGISKDKDASSDANMRAIMRTMVGYVNYGDVFHNTAYNSTWPALLSWLHDRGACEDVTWNFYQQYHNETNHGGYVFIGFEMGYYMYYQEEGTGAITPGTVCIGTYGQLLGSNYYTPYASKSDAQAAMIADYQSGRAIIDPVPHGSGYSCHPCRMMLGLGTEAPNICTVKTGESSGTVNGAYFTNWIISESNPGKYWYGRGYWFGSGTTPPPGPDSVSITYEVEGFHSGDPGIVASGTKITPHFRMYAKASQSDIDKIRNSGCWYNVKWSGTTASPIATYPQGGSTKYVNIGAKPGGSLDTWDRTGHSAPASGGTSIMGTTTIRMSGDQLASWLENGGDYLVTRYDTTLSSPYNKDKYITAKFTLSITAMKGNAACTTFTVSCSPGDTDKTTVDNPHKTEPSAYNSGWVSWSPVPIGELTPIPWSFSTEDNVMAYAEVVANEVGYLSTSDRTNFIKPASDWNVNGGVPSTENLAVAAGGTCYVYDLAGLITPGSTSRTFNVDNGTIVNNTNAGVKQASPTVERTITINVKVTNIWDSNDVCTITCPGHEWTQSNTISVSATGAGNKDEATCDWCDTKISVEGTTTPGYTDPPTTPGGTGTYHDPVDNTVDDSHTCTVKLKFDCATGTWTASGDTTGLSSDTKTARYDQGYNGSAGAKNLKGTVVVTGSVNESLFCEGYTSGKGCTVSHNTNCVHRDSKTKTFKIVETLDNYAYRSILNAKVYALSDAQIVDVNEDIVNRSAVGYRVSNSQLYVDMWRQDGGYLNDAQNGDTTDERGGRLWFTQFKNPNYNGGWTSTTVYYTNNNNTAHMGYWLGDATIDIVVNADSTAADTANPSALDNAPSLSTKRGDSLSHYSASVTSSSTSYKGHNGDTMTSEQINNLALHCANAWQNNNNDLYTINVISDCLMAGVSTATVSLSGNVGDTFQNIIADVYAVDNGIRLFDYGFTAVNETHYRNHTHSVSWESVKTNFLNAAYSLSDVGSNKESQIALGYLGSPDDDARVKYGISDDVGSLQSAKIRTMNNTFVLMLKKSCAGELTTEQLNWNTKGGAKWTCGSPQSTIDNWPYGVGVTYKYIDEVFGSSDYGKTKWNMGCTHIDQITVGNTYETNLGSAPKFEGYYNTHIYPYKSAGNLQTYARRNYGNANLYQFDITESGNAPANGNYSYNGYYHNYNTALVMSNIPMEATAPNGIYSKPVTVKVNYSLIVDFQNAKSDSNVKTFDKRNLSQEGCYTNTYKNKDGETGHINDIIIQNPVTVEYCAIIGNGAGAYASGVVDESREDMRVYADAGYWAYSNKPEAQKNNYIVMGNTFHLWFSDFGDFYDETASWDQMNPNGNNKRGVGCINNACSSDTGKILKESDKEQSQAYGYADNMLCTKWTKARYVTFTFPVSYIDILGNKKLVPANVEIDLADVRCLKSDASFGESSDSDAMHKPSTSLLNFSNTNPQVGPVKFGLDYEFTCLASALESAAGQAIVTNVANNAPSSYNRTKTSLSENNEMRGDGVSEHAARKVYEVEIVGRIGNLAVEDTEDFRFSNLFKKAESGWLINNVIHSVNSKYPNVIISTKADLLLNTCSNTTTGLRHNTTSVNATTYMDMHNLGKAGDFYTLPLVARYNPVNEFKSEQMRLGYSAFMDIETMGNYYGINYTIKNDPSPDSKTGVITEPTQGPTSATGSQEDKREYFMEIVPHYVLYDYVSKEYIPISMYAGQTGNYTRFWTTGAQLTNSVASLYIDVNTDRYRWNVGSAEQDVSGAFVHPAGGNVNVDAFGQEDYIGTASRIVLDQYDRTYIGSSILYGSIYKDSSINVASDGRTQFLFNASYSTSYDEVSATAYDGLEELSFIRQGQRWYFKLGVPSSTYVTTSTANPNNQVDIANNHEALKAAHPHSVILCYASIVVHGEVWSLKYNYAQENNGDVTFTLFNSTDDVPADVPNPSACVGSINPTTNPNSGITPEMAPLFIMDAWNTSAQDWDTYGTH